MGYSFNNNYSQFYMPPFGFYGKSAATKTETEAEKQERIKKEEAEKAAAEFQKRMELIKNRAENEEKLNQQIKELEKYSKELNTTIDRAKKGKETEEGTIKVKETWEDYKKLPWWKKGLRATGQLVQGTWKLAMTFVGYETDEKTGEYSWNWKTGLKNAAIAAGCIALTAIPVAGPAISTGLLTTGVVCGTIGVGKGIHKACNAKSPEELDNAYQDVGAGLTIGVTSALGLRSLGKGLQASSATTAGSSARATGSNVVSQWIKDATINAYRATVDGMKVQKATVASQGFLKTYGANLKNSFVPKLGKSKFENANNETIQQLNTRITNIDQKLADNGINPLEKVLLEREKLVLEAQKTELGSTITKDGWKNLRNNSKLRTESNELQGFAKEFQSNGSIEINGTTFNSTSENIKAIESAIKESKKLSKQIETLAKLRSSTMKKMAFSNKFASEVESYTGKTRTNRFERVYDAAKISKSDITWKNALMAPLKTIWNYMNIPFKVWGYTDKNGGNGFYKIQETFIPVYEAGMLDMFLGFGEHELTTVVTGQNEKGETIQQEVAVNKEVLAQLEAQAKQTEEALSKAKEELNNLYMA